MAVVLFRLSAILAGRGYVRIARMVASWNLILTGADMSLLGRIGQGFHVKHPEHLVADHGYEEMYEHLLIGDGRGYGKYLPKFIKKWIKKALFFCRSR